MKKIVSILLAAVLVLSLAATAFAADGETAQAAAEKEVKTEAKKPANGQRRSKRYVKGNAKKAEPRETDEEFRL